GTVNHRAPLGSKGNCHRAVPGTTCLTLTTLRTFPPGAVAFGRLGYCSRLPSSSRWGFSSRNIGFRCIPTPPWLLRLPHHKLSGLALTVHPNDANDLHSHPAARPCRPAHRPCDGEHRRLLGPFASENTVQWPSLARNEFDFIVLFNILSRVLRKRFVYYYI